MKKFIKAAESLERFVAFTEHEDNLAEGKTLEECVRNILKVCDKEDIIEWNIYVDKYEDGEWVESFKSTDVWDIADEFDNINASRNDKNTKKFIRANNRPAPKRAVKANLYDDVYSDIELSRSAYIQEWQDDYPDEEIRTSWDNIFDKVLDDFVLYCDDEASDDGDGTIEEKVQRGEYTAADVENEFDQWVEWVDFFDYDY